MSLCVVYVCVFDHVSMKKTMKDKYWVINLEYGEGISAYSMKLK